MMLMTLSITVCLGMLAGYLGIYALAGVLDVLSDKLGIPPRGHPPCFRQ